MADKPVCVGQGGLDVEGFIVMEGRGHGNMDPSVKHAVIVSDNKNSLTKNSQGVHWGG
ncbi:hypothetical protein CULCOIPH002_17810 [Corynebacterium ulcerans]|nr:hypothetical protein CULCOIPH002_17810 [Corynebacterium ulcerans]GJJ37427.1 hypothetical protein CULCOIPH003_00580 [Corynebacterium ulcerans]